MAFGMINDYGTILMLSSTIIILISYSNTSIHVWWTGVCEVEWGLVSSVLTRLEHLVSAGALALVLEGRAGVHLGGGAGGRRLEVLGVDALAVLRAGLGPGAARAAAGLVPRHVVAADERLGPAPGLTRAQVPGEPAHLVLPEAAGGQGLPGGRAAAHGGLLLLHAGGLLLLHTGGLLQHAGGLLLHAGGLLLDTPLLLLHAGGLLQAGGLLHAGGLVTD